MLVSSCHQVVSLFTLPNVPLPAGVTVDNTRSISSQPAPCIHDPLILFFFAFPVRTSCFTCNCTLAVENLYAHSFTNSTNRRIKAAQLRIKSSSTVRNFSRLSPFPDGKPIFVRPAFRIIYLLIGSSGWKTQRRRRETLEKRKTANR